MSRVFRKSAGVKKYYPSLNPTRAVMNNPYNINLEVGPNSMNMPPPSMMQLGLDSSSAAAAHNFHLYGRNYINTPDHVAEVTRLLRAGVVPMHQYSHLNFPVSSSSPSPLDGGGFTISGLNLNLGGGASSQQPTLRPMPSTTTTTHMAAHQLHDFSSNMISNNSNNVVGYGGGDEVNNPNTNGHGNNNRYNMQGAMDHCVDLDHYWPPSY